MAKGKCGHETRMVKNGVILDTNIAIGLLNDNHSIVQTIQNLQDRGYDFYFSVITKCELLSGVKNDSELRLLKRVSNKPIILFNNGMRSHINGEMHPICIPRWSWSHQGQGFRMKRLPNGYTRWRFVFYVSTSTRSQ